jgi:transposase
MAVRRKYPGELRERAVKMVFEVRERDGRAWGAGPGGQAAGCSPGGFCGPGVKQAEIEGGERPGTTTGDKQRSRLLRRGYGGSGSMNHRLARRDRPSPEPLYEQAQRVAHRVVPPRPHAAPDLSVEFLQFLPDLGLGPAHDQLADARP